MIVELYKTERKVFELSREYGVSKVTIYKWIKQIYFESNRRYGAIKVHRQLIKAGFSVSLKHVQRLMKSTGLASIIQKKYKP